MANRPPTPSQKGEVSLSKVLVPMDQQSRCMLKIQWKISKYLRGKMDAALNSFIRMDEDGDGRLSKGEFQAFCRRLGLGLTVTEMDLLGDHLGIKEDGTVTFDDLKKFVESDEVMRFIGIQSIEKFSLTDGDEEDIDDDREDGSYDGDEDHESLPFEERLTKPEHWGTRSIVQRIYEQLCVQEKPFYDIFSRFDDDHDGYISYRDFLRGLRSINLTLSIADLNDFLSLVDVKGAGVLHIETVARIFGDTNTYAPLPLPRAAPYSSLAVNNLQLTLN
jgi:Ca2+-binding EF-hand superfamily protein